MKGERSRFSQGGSLLDVSNLGQSVICWASGAEGQLRMSPEGRLPKGTSYGE